MAAPDGLSIRFGPVPPKAERDNFRRKMNAEIMALLRVLPASVQTDAAMALIQHFHTPLQPGFDFFRRYHSPAWSILHWLTWLNADRAPFDPEERRAARTAHAMALFLHPLDDHLHDGQLPPTHVLLLLRSEAWRRMCAALEALAGGISGGGTIVRGCLDDYYASIGTPAGDETLEGYCRHFRRQMATWTCVPLLLATKMADDDGFRDAVQSAFEQFGTAWRLLDDLQDAAADRQSGHHSAVYCALPAAARAAWDQGRFGGGDPPSQTVWPTDRQNEVAEILSGRIGRELAAAAATSDAIGLNEWADEMRCLAAPFGSGQAAR